MTGLRSPEAGLGNWGLVDEGFAQRLAPGVYRLTSIESHKRHKGQFKKFILCLLCLCG